jgi:hypothetical protein
MNLSLRSESGASLTFHSRSISETGWVNSYFVTAEAPGFSASIDVDNAPYGSSPAVLFGDIAKDWAGWKGVKGWQALEGEYGLSATSDSTGHITLTATLNSGTPSTWEGKVAVILEAGAVEVAAARAKDFFGPVSSDNEP